MKLSGKEFEAIVKERGELEHKNGAAIWKKNGRTARMSGAPGTGQMSAVPAYVDFSGTVPLQCFTPTGDVDAGGALTFDEETVGLAIHFDCKVCSQASLSLQSDHFSNKQKRQLLDHASYGAVCFLLIHFNARELATKSDPAVTVAMPLHPDHTFWRDVLDDRIATLSRATAFEYGVVVKWDAPGRTLKERPDVLAAVHTLRAMEIPAREETEAPW